MSSKRYRNETLLESKYLNRKYTVLSDTTCWENPNPKHNYFIRNKDFERVLKEGTIVEFLPIKKVPINKRGPAGNQQIAGYLIPITLIRNNKQQGCFYVTEKDFKRGRFKGQYTLSERRARNKYIYDLLQESKEQKQKRKKYGHSFHGIFAIKEATAYQPELYQNNENLKYPVSPDSDATLLANDSKEWKSAFSKLLKRYFKLDKNKIAIDLGCGGNQFLNKLRENGMTGIGVDISNPAADIIAPIHNTGINNSTANLITAFDVMEHLEPDGVKGALIEMKRIAKPNCMFIFTIATWSAIRKVANEKSHDVYELHPTQKSEDWWKDKLDTYDFKINRLEQVVAQSGNTKEEDKIELRVWGTINNQNTI